MRRRAAGSDPARTMGGEEGRMRDQWMLIVAIVIIGAWAARLLIAGAGIGMSLWMTSGGLAVAGFLLLNWYFSRRRRRGPTR